MIQKLQRGWRFIPVVPGMSPTDSEIEGLEREIQRREAAARLPQQRNEQIGPALPKVGGELGRLQRLQKSKDLETKQQEDAFKAGVGQMLIANPIKDISDAMYEGNKVTIWPETKVSSAGLMLAGLAAPAGLKLLSRTRKLVPSTGYFDEGRRYLKYKNLDPQYSQITSPVDNFFNTDRILLTRIKEDASYPPIKWGPYDEIHFTILPDELYTPDFIKSRYDTDIPTLSDLYDAQKLFVDKINNNFGSNATVERLFKKSTGEVNRDEITRIYNNLQDDTERGLFGNYWNQYAGYMNKKLIPFSEQREAYKNGLQFAADYFYSPGYVERFNKQKFKYGNYPEQKYIFPKENLVKWIEGRNNATSSLKFGLFDSRRFGFRLGETGTHEAFHWNPTYNKKSKVSGVSVSTESPYYNNNYSNIPQEIKEILTPSQDALKRRHSQGLGDLEHDAELSEQYSDLGALRYNLNKEGIFDSRKIGEQFNQKMLDMFRGTKSAKTDRFLDLHTDDQIIKAVNEIAANNKSNLNNYV